MADSKVAPFIVEARDYYDEKNRHVRERVVVDGEVPEGFARFVMMGTVEKAMPGGKLRKEFPVTLAAETVAGAFAVAEEAIAREKPKQEAELLKEIMRRQRSLVRAGPRAVAPPPPGPGAAFGGLFKGNGRKRH